MAKQSIKAQLLAMAAPINAERDRLEKAIREGDADRVRSCLPMQWGVNYHTAWSDKQTPLHLAARAGNSEICQILIEAGATLDARNRFDETPLHSAVTCVGVCRVLIAAGADIHAHDGHEQKPIHYAAKKGSPDVCRLLLECGASTDDRCAIGSTPLHFAAEHGKVGVCAVLLSLGANPNARNSKGLTALSYAKNGDICAVLVGSGGESDHAPKNAGPDYLTPFQLAIKEGRLDAVRFFIEKCGEDIAQRTLRGRTMLQVASRQPKSKEYLLSLKTLNAIEDAANAERRPVPTTREPATWLSPL